MGDKETTLQTAAVCPGEAGTDTNLTFVQTKIKKLPVNRESTFAVVFTPAELAVTLPVNHAAPLYFGNYLEPDSRSPPGGQAFED